MQLSQALSAYRALWKSTLARRVSLVSEPHPLATVANARRTKRQYLLIPRLRQKPSRYPIQNR